jgi:acetyl-CoA carboxylase carboxyltransferase component
MLEKEYSSCTSGAAYLLAFSDKTIFCEGFQTQVLNQRYEN